MPDQDKDNWLYDFLDELRERAKLTAPPNSGRTVMKSKCIINAF